MAEQKGFLPSKGIGSSETEIEFQLPTRRCIQEDRTVMWTLIVTID
jgi:hypothetical protein